MTKGEYIVTIRKALEQVEHSSCSPREASDLLLRAARSVYLYRTHTPYGKKNKWDECPNTVFHQMVDEGVEDSHAQCGVCSGRENA